MAERAPPSPPPDAGPAAATSPPGGADGDRVDEAAGDLRAEFSAEAREQLEALDEALLAVEREGSSPAGVAAIFRPLHSMKGAAVALGFQRLAALAHAGEEVLVGLDGGPLHAGAAGALIAWLEAARAVVEEVAAHGDDAGPAARAAIERARSWLGAASIHLDAGIPGAAPAGADAGVVAGPAADASQLHAQASREGLLRALRSARAPDGPPLAEGTVRVSRRLLAEEERLVAALDEEVGRLRQACAASPALAAAVDRLGLIAAALDVVMRRTRVQPIGALFLGAPRLVRDLARLAGKEAVVEARGGDLELPRALLESIRDPLGHLLRNAVAHGIEPAAVRRAAGKPPAGRITLSAGRAAGTTWMAVEDDGGGIDLARVSAVARARGLARPAPPPAGARPEPDSPEGRLDLAHAVALLVLPGFSTAERVTHLAGRGVGLDVVKVAAERAGGRLEVESAQGRGTRVCLLFPDPG